MRIADTISMTKREVLALIAVEPVLKRLGLSLYCMRCHSQGHADGVRADNDPQGAEINVVCNCTVRRYVHSH